LLPVALLERPPERPGTLAVEIQIECVNGVLVFQCPDPYVKNLVVLAEAMKEEQGSKAVTGLRVVKATALIVDEVLLGEHCCKDGEIELLKVTFLWNVHFIFFGPGTGSGLAYLS